MTVPCGGCVGCRLARSQAWAVRLQHEAKFHEAKSFVTLTYDDAWLPDDYSVSLHAVQKFMKRLRKQQRNNRIRFFACGEYGEENLRPHYHLILFGCDFLSDRTPFRTGGSGHTTYISPSLVKLWPFGFSEIGNVSVESCAYVARYVMKKVNGEAADEHYRRFHPLTGVECQVQPEFLTMSKKPGIGADWWDKYSMDAFPSDFVVLDGRKYPVPRYYKDRLSDEDAALVVQKRKRKALARAADQTPERLAVRQTVTELRLKQLKRSL